MKIGFLTLGRIGDMVLSTPAFSAIKNKYPEAEIYVISGRGNADILKHNPNIHKIIKYEKTPAKLIRFILKLRQINFDYWIDPKNHYSTESKIIAKLAKAKNKISFIYGNNNQNENKYFTDIVFDALKMLDIVPPPPPILPEIFLGNESINEIKSIILKNGKINLLINISATSPSRVYNADNLSKVLSKINLEKFNIYLNAMENEKFIAEEIIQKFRNKSENTNSNTTNIILLPKFSINSLAAFIKECDLIITPDTSIIHIAAAFKKNLIALYTDNKHNLVKFGTNNPNAKIISQSDSDNVNQIPAELLINEKSDIE